MSVVPGGRGPTCGAPRLQMIAMPLITLFTKTKTSRFETLHGTVTKVTDKHETFHTAAINGEV